MSNGELIKAEREIKSLYRSGKRHFTDEIQLNKDGGLYEVFKYMHEVSKNTGLPTLEPSDVFKKLSDVDYITTIMKKSKDLETLFRGTFNLKTDRVNNFTFRFRSQVEYNQSPKVVTEKFNERA